MIELERSSLEAMLNELFLILARDSKKQTAKIHKKQLYVAVLCKYLGLNIQGHFKKPAHYCKNNICKPIAKILVTLIKPEDAYKDIYESLFQAITIENPSQLNEQITNIAGKHQFSNNAQQQIQIERIEQEQKRIAALAEAERKKALQRQLDKENFLRNILKYSELPPSSLACDLPTLLIEYKFHMEEVATLPRIAKLAKLNGDHIAAVKLLVEERKRLESIEKLEAKRLLDIKREEQKALRAIERQKQEEHYAFERSLISSVNAIAKLGITRTEYNRWISESKIRVHGKRIGGPPLRLEYNVHLPETISNITPQLIEEWRSNHKKIISERRKVASKGATAKASKTRELKVALGVSNYADQFPVARLLTRNIRVCLGPTNSGKTHAAMQTLAGAASGVYLAPLRLLALEAYDTLTASGIKVDLITGEERIITPGATHICATIEMLNYVKQVEVIVIDEIQMISDEKRGWAWVSALLGAPASTVFVCGAEHARNSIKEILSVTKDTIIESSFSRLCDLTVISTTVEENEIYPGDAIIVFSRKEVLYWAAKLKSRGISTSLIYGALPPAVRRHQAKRFRDGVTDVIISTDAIGMGLNVPIKRILFTDLRKYNGAEMAYLTFSEIQQIAGRAGRFGLHPIGYVGMLRHPSYERRNQNHEDLNRRLQVGLRSPPKSITGPYHIRPSWIHMQLVMAIKEMNSVSEAMKFWSKMNFGAIYGQPNIESQFSIAYFIEDYFGSDVSNYDLFQFSNAPIDLNEYKFRWMLITIIDAHINQSPVPIEIFINLKFDGLQEAEQAAKFLNVVTWAYLNYPETLSNPSEITRYKEEVDTAIIGFLNKGIKSELAQRSR